ncbi:MAG TPA: flavodoxin reductase [Candidatus Kapabacteria bacterium]|nr:flavodoxin reductase [Candidatus Kapabacteria bacterium]
MSHIVKILSIEHLTHDVLRIIAEKPIGLNFTPGQATDISINKEEWKNEIRTFTFTSLPSADHIEFNIKTYPDHNGVTNQLLSLKAGDELITYDVYGDIHYKGEGIFIAGGAGITPFTAILNSLEANNQIGNNKLIFANKTKADIMLEDKFNKLLGKNFINVLSDEAIDGYEHGFVTAEIIKKYMDDTTKFFYLCGPPPMMNAVEKALASLSIADEFIVKEGF